MEYDLQTSRELDSVLNIYRKNGKQMTFVGKHAFDKLELSHDPQYYVDVLKSLNYIEFSKYGSGAIERIDGYWNITLTGKSFKGFEQKFKIESNWFYKENYTNLKYVITTVAFIVVNIVGWVISIYYKCK